MTDSPGFVQGRPVTQAPLDEAAPNRSNGTVPPRRGPGRPAGSKTQPKSLETQIGATLTVLNMMVMSIPRLNADALDATEVQALARAIDLQCKTSPRFRRYVEAALTAGSGAGLLGVVLMIGARRLARHGVFPADADPLIGMMMQSSVQAPREPVTN